MHSVSMPLGWSILQLSVLFQEAAKAKLGTGDYQPSSKRRTCPPSGSHVLCLAGLVLKSNVVQLSE